MKSRIALLLVLVLTIALSLSAQVKKYDIKSGIVTFEITMHIGQMNIAQKAVVYFDDYGMKECKDLYSGDKLKESYLSDGKKLYSVIYAKNIAYDRGTAYSGTEKRYDWNDISDKDKKDGAARKIPNMTVAGKSCEAFETGPANGKTTYAGWSHILLYLDSVGSSSQSTIKAVKIEENVSVPPDKFKVP
ncbi:MAG TPA: hypothetical protein VMG09_01770, partial [Bacteroidota bacterium]|nr:hypothetical protein [Bacteroidota bacterium]